MPVSVIDPGAFLQARSLAIEPPPYPLHGRVHLPGSKSITNRALLIAALAKGTSRLSGALKSDDTRYMAEALRRMGARIDEPDATGFVVRGGGLHAPAAPLFVGNAGTAARFLTATAATLGGKTVIDGDGNMRRRPIRPLVDALAAIGVAIVAPTGCLPVTIDGSGLSGGRLAIDAALSSQYVSALLMAAARGARASEISLAGQAIGARGYVDLTLAVMRAFGGLVAQAGAGAWRVEPTGYHATDFDIEPDASAATYFWAASALTGGQIDLGLTPEHFTQPDTAACDLIRQFPRLPAIIDGAQIQDAVPTLATLAAVNDHPVRFTGIANLRVKECDRVAVLAKGLCEIRPDLASIDGDDLLVRGDRALTAVAKGVAIETHDDHRIAMAFAVLGLRVAGIRILDPGCVAKTCPDFWTMLSSLGVNLEPFC